VVVRAPVGERASADLLKPLLADPATLEVVSHVSEAQGDVVLLIDADVLGTSHLASAHAHRHARRAGLLVLGYTPMRVLHERAPADFATRLRSEHYESRCELYEREPHAVLTHLWGGNLSIRRADLVGGGGFGADEPVPSDRELGRLCLAAGLEAVFDRSLRALRIYEPSLGEFVRDARGERDSTRASEHPAVDAAASLALRALVLATGSAHLWRAQDTAARLLWALESRRGAEA
jgi:hypothetical protein